MGIFSDVGTKKKLGDGVLYVDAAWGAQDIGALVLAFQNVCRLASEVEVQLAPKVSLSATWGDSHEKTLMAARAIIQASDAFLSSCEIQGDRLKSWDPSVAEQAVRTVRAAWTSALS
jgi:hypothetical protein